jgi:hypothetical protein
MQIRERQNNKNGGNYKDVTTFKLSGFGGLGVAFSTQVRGFFRAKKSSARLPSEGK